ncbi:MAG: hypothetical protein ACOC2W_00200 [bacterium]
MKRTRFEPNYWVVGASWDEDDMFDIFITRGYWECGYESGEVLKYDKRLSQINIGDRIAIKSMLGRGESNIKIKALGIIKDVEMGGDKRVYVDWILSDLNRSVSSKGCYGTIHGPFNLKKDPEWLGQVFSI